MNKHISHYVNFAMSVRYAVTCEDRRSGVSMNIIKTGALLAFMTALFMGVGLLIGGQTGMIIALVIAVGMNFFSYWNSDKMVLKMHNAVEVDHSNAPEYLSLIHI